MQEQGLDIAASHIVPAAADLSPTLANALAAAEDAVARLDERLAKSPIAAAFAARTHLRDAAAALLLDGELIALEDLVLHDAAADVRAPTPALTRAHAALRARRRLATAAPGWALTRNGLDTLRGAAPDGAPAPAPVDAIRAEEAAFAAELAAIDALIARSSRLLEAGHARSTAPPPAPDRAAPRQKALEAWRETIARAVHEPPVVAAARAGAALESLAPLPGQAWLGRLLVADFLRARGKTRHHLAALNLGMTLATRDRRRPRRATAADEVARLALWVLAITCAAEAGLADHDHLITARHLFERKLAGRRATSRLPALVDLVMRSPVVSTNTIATELKVTPRAAQNLVAELGLRELTGRGRYRCWGLL